MVICGVLWPRRANVDLMMVIRISKQEANAVFLHTEFTDDLYICPLCGGKVFRVPQVSQLEEMLSVYQKHS